MELAYPIPYYGAAKNLGEISRKLKFPPTTTRRLLKLTMLHRLMQQDPMTQLHRLGPGISYLVSVATEGLNIRRAALAVLEHLRGVAGENTARQELRDRKRVCIEKVESKEVLRDTTPVSDQFPALQVRRRGMEPVRHRCANLRCCGREWVIV